MNFQIEFTSNVKKIVLDGSDRVSIYIDNELVSVTDNMYNVSEEFKDSIIETILEKVIQIRE